MRPPTIQVRKSAPIGVLAIAFLMVFAWTVILASAQSKTPAQVTEEGTILTANKLVLQEYLPLRVLLSGTAYTITGSTKFLDATGMRVPRGSIPVGSPVNIVYVTGKRTSEVYPFDPSDKVLQSIQAVSATGQ